MTNIHHKLKALAVIAALSAASVASAQVTLTPIERTGTASGPLVEDEAPAAKPKKVAKAKPCKKKGGGLGGLLSAVKKTGLAGTLTNQAVGGGMGGYAAGRVADVAVDEGAKAEQQGASGAKTDC